MANTPSLNRAKEYVGQLPLVGKKLSGLTKVLTVCPLLTVLGCVSDFSPDPYSLGIPITSTANAPDAAKTMRPTRVDSGVTDAGVKRDAKVADPTDPSDPTDPTDPSDPGNPTDPSDPGKPTDPSDPGTKPTTDGGTPKPDDVPTLDKKGGCDLTGRYLMTERLGLSALGAKQITYNWFYLEVVQKGSQLTYQKAVLCGTKVTGLPPVGISMDDSKSWPEYMVQRTYQGRTGTSEASGDGCKVAVEKTAIIRGATVETYRDTAVPMPKVEEEADDVSPGWEDWDKDGKPGVSLRISGTITGTLYASMRTWTQYAGTIAADADTFKMGIPKWAQERSTLGYDGSPLLTADAARDTDEAQHIAEFTRVTEEQVGGDDATKCKAVRELAPTLTPNAAK